MSSGCNMIHKALTLLCVYPQTRQVPQPRSMWSAGLGEESQQPQIISAVIQQKHGSISCCSSVEPRYDHLWLLLTATVTLLAGSTSERAGQRDPGSVPCPLSGGAPAGPPAPDAPRYRPGAMVEPQLVLFLFSERAQLWSCTLIRHGWCCL